MILRQIDFSWCIESQAKTQGICQAKTQAEIFPIESPSSTRKKKRKRSGSDGDDDDDEDDAPLSSMRKKRKSEDSKSGSEKGDDDDEEDDDEPLKKKKKVVIRYRDCKQCDACKRRLSQPWKDCGECQGPNSIANFWLEF